jgi:5-(carboxyamino)imidazole ribonucleotide synthase
MVGILREPAGLPRPLIGAGAYTLASMVSARHRPILPPATIGILGGGQLGRMLGLAARELGYRIAVLDPDPDCPASAVADRVEIGAYHDIEAARRLAGRCDVVTYELEHVALAVIDVLATVRPVRPGRPVLQVSQDRLQERRFLERIGAAVAPWREVSDETGLGTAALELDLPLRLKAATGGYDGRSQVRIASIGDLDDAFGRLRRPPGEPALIEKELPFSAELSVIVARGVDAEVATYPTARNRHDAGILVESVAPAPIGSDVDAAAQALARQIAEALDLVGVLTVELFLLPGGRLVVNELAPRVHNSGHWTIEAAITSQFEQHVRAVCGLPLGPTSLRLPAATLNLLGEGRRRPARLAGVPAALRAADVHLHLYDKREVFERRKMGHLTALAPTVDEALERGRAALASLAWEGEA